MRARDPRKEKAIRDQALAMIVRQGFDGLSMQKLARAARISPATIYIYFQDREDLILKLYEDVTTRMFAATLEHFDPTMPFDQGLKMQWINRARYFLKYPREMHFMEQIRFSPLHERATQAADGGFRRAMMAFVSNAIRQKQLVAVPLEVYWSVAFAPLYQLVKFHMHGKGMSGTGPFVLDDKILDLTLKLVLKALKP
jgi:AcrR family transcriptional regulator